MYNYTELFKQINSLKQKVKHYENLLHNLPIFEYHLGTIKVEKVKGTIQLGKLFQEEEIETEGVHKIYVDDIVIKEIESSGTLGVGIVEKSSEKQKDKNKVTPEEAEPEIKEIYEEIKNKLNIDQVPSLFQEIATKKAVLKQVWFYLKNIKGTKDFYTAIASGLDNLFNESTNDIANYDLVQDHILYEKVRKEMERQVKTFYLILHLFKLLLTGYLEKYREQMVSIEQLSIQKEIQPAEMIDKLKATYHLHNTPKSLQELEKHPNIAAYWYNDLLVPLNKAGDDNEFITKLIDYILTYFESIKDDEQSDVDLKVEEKAFLFAVMIKHMEDIPKYIYLEKVLIHLID
ncbi:hypothetical protein [Aquibacillus kalidii]|uniref:hypothetical protein n=1 Tax=Aquibacillus kalidii TaxID=2762597 RepID=UPI0016487076|nr:hypothetical protein [Aquibacillus kalidii]